MRNIGPFLPGPDPDHYFRKQLGRPKNHLATARLKKIPSQTRAGPRKKITRHHQCRQGCRHT